MRRQRQHRPSAPFAAMLVAGATAAIVVIVAVAVGQTGSGGNDSTPLSPPSNDRSPSATSSDSSSPFDSRTYPEPSGFPDWGWVSGCPSPIGTSGGEPASSPVNAVMRLSDGLDQALHASDRALWPVLRRAYKVGDFGPFTDAPLSVLDGHRYYKRAIVTSYCGPSILRNSRWVHVCAHGSPSCGPHEGGSLARDFLVLHRSDQWLVWFLEL